jgi:hypothetical protein
MFNRATNGSRRGGLSPRARARSVLLVAAMLAQRPNDTRVSGAGPPRKPVLRLKACKAPHPLQPIVRLRPRAVADDYPALFCRFGVGSPTELFSDISQRLGPPIKPNR